MITDERSASSGNEGVLQGLTFLIALKEEWQLIVEPGAHGFMPLPNTKAPWSKHGPWAPSASVLHENIGDEL